MNVVSYAQNFEDVILWRAFSNVDVGFYVDVGANSPTHESVTKHFYDAGWSGINIEPIADWFDELAKHRPRDTNLAVCASDSTGEIEILDVHETGLSTKNLDLRKFYEERFDVEVVNATTTTLTDILSTHAPDDIHFMKIDVEGMEYETLSGCDFSRFRPRVVLVESIDPQTHELNHQRWEPLLVQADYSFLYFDGINRFYGANEHLSSLKQHFEKPPNLFDRFVRSHHADVERRLVESGHTVSSLRAELEATNLRLEDVLAQRHSLEQELDSAEDAILSLQTHTTELEQTVSWRVTSPLRWLRRRVKIEPAVAMLGKLRQR